MFATTPTSHGIIAPPKCSLLIFASIYCRHLIEIKENYETSIDNVFAGGDLVQKKATVCMAIKNGKEAAKEINNELKNNSCVRKN